MIRIRLLFLAALALALPAAAQSSTARSWQTDVPCTAGRNPVLRVAATPRETVVPGCARAYCTSLPDGRRVCSCTRDTTGTVMRVEAGGRALREWPADCTFHGGR